MEQQRGDVQVLERAEASLLAGVFDAGEHRGDQLVEQVQDVVEGRGLLDLGEGEEGRVAAGRGHPGDGLRRAAAAYRARAWTRTGGTADRSMWLTPRARISWSRCERLDQAGDADPGRGAAEPLQG